jgi:hypothetical protein
LEDFHFGMEAFGDAVVSGEAPIRLAELYHRVRGDPVRSDELHRHSEAVSYLLRRVLHRADVIEELRIHAPGRCLRARLTTRRSGRNHRRLYGFLHAH